MSRLQQERIDELARLLDGEVTDRSSSEAQQLLVLANAVRDTAPEMARPTPAFRAQLRAQLVEEAATSQVGAIDRMRDAVRERTARWRYSARVATASATASLMIGSAGAAVAAQSALPGELLYPLKQATESVRLALASGSEEVGRLQLDLARERLEELTEGVGSLTSSQVIDTLGAMDRHTEAGAEELLAAFDRTQVRSLLDDLQAFTEEQRSALTALLDELPLEAVPFADRSFELLRRIDVQSEISAASCDCGIGELSGDLAGASAAVGRGITSPGEGPAAPPCDCVDGETAPPARDGGVISDTLDGTQEWFDGGEADDGTAGGGSEGGGSSSSIGGAVSGPVGTITEPVDDLTEPVEEVTEPVENLTEPVEELVDTVTEPVQSATEAVEDAIDEITDTVEDVTTEVDDTVEDVASEVGDLLP